jgi:hypothetical protein
LGILCCIFVKEILWIILLHLLSGFFTIRLATQLSKTWLQKYILTSNCINHSHTLSTLCFLVYFTFYYYFRECKKIIW